MWLLCHKSPSRMRADMSCLPTRQLRLPFAPPLAMVAARAAEGIMTLRFMRVSTQGGGHQQYQVRA